MEQIPLDGHIVIIQRPGNDSRKLENRMAAGRDDGVTFRWLREDEGEYLRVPRFVSVRHPILRIRKGENLRSSAKW